MTIKQDFVFEPEKPRRAMRLFCIVVPLIAVGIISWFLGGNRAWGIGNILIGGVILLIGFGQFVLLLHELRVEVIALAFNVLGVLGLLPLWVLNKLEIKTRHAVSYLLALWAVWASVGLLFPLTTITIHSAANEPDGQMRVIYLGRELGTINPSSDETFHLRGALWSNWLRIESPGLRGWHPRAFTIHSGNRVYLERAPTRTFLIDNRNHPAAIITCGEFKTTVPADSVARRSIFAPAGSPSDVQVDGVDAGAVDGAYVLIDTLGTRTYRLREIIYQTSLSRLSGKPLVVAPPLEAVFRGSRVHRLPRSVEHFLAKAPKEIDLPLLPIGTDEVRQGELLEEK